MHIVFFSYLCMTLGHQDLTPIPWTSFNMCNGTARRLKWECLALVMGELATFFPSSCVTFYKEIFLAT